ncbi:MAG: hypothetical protein WDO24_03250 [Pseudomonadota bacterium]
MPEADLAWSDGDIARFSLPDRFAVLAPGSAPHRPDKRWPVAHYGALASHLAERGLVPDRDRRCRRARSRAASATPRPARST